MISPTTSNFPRGFPDASDEAHSKPPLPLPKFYIHPVYSRLMIDGNQRTVG